MSQEHPPLLLLDKHDYTGLPYSASLSLTRYNLHCNLHERCDTEIPEIPMSSLLSIAVGGPPHGGGGPGPRPCVQDHQVKHPGDAAHRHRVHSGSTAGRHLPHHRLLLSTDPRGRFIRHEMKFCLRKLISSMKLLYLHLY